MIAFLMCFVLLPISRLLRKFAGRKPEHDDLDRGGAPSLPMTEKETSVGGGLQLETLPQEQNALLEQRLGAESASQRGGCAGTGVQWPGQGSQQELVAQGDAPVWGERFLRWAECDRAHPGEQPAQNPSTALDLGMLLGEADAQSWGIAADRLQEGWSSCSWPGPEEEQCYPPWQVQGMSYYPRMETAPVEEVGRVWEDLSGLHSRTCAPQGSSPATTEPFEFTVMSYNLLSQDLLVANPDLYAHCFPEVLAWEFRLRNILQEFQTWQPDILCLQEVQENHFWEQLEPVLSVMGYSCVYKRRTGRKTDGCAICYKPARFRKVSCSLVEFYRPEVELLDRDNVGVVTLLQPVTPEGSEVWGQRSKAPPLCIANTHLLYNPMRGDVKLAQLALLLAEIDRALKPWREEGVQCPVILCGDFNSIPYMPLYQFICTGQMYYHGLPAWMISGQEDLSHKLNQRRLYAPLWPSSLGISDNCQYFAVCDKKKKNGQEKEEKGKLQYSHKCLLQFRFCEIACTRPEYLVCIPGVTDAKPDPSKIQAQALKSLPEPDPEKSSSRFRNTIFHGFDLTSVYSHYISGTEKREVTTLHCGSGATVDYIFYSAVPVNNRSQRGGRLKQDGVLKLMGRLSLLSEEQLWSTKGLPNEVFSSDHLSLLAKFQLDHTWF
nr:PREDICTED: protein angel homolog 1 isoform X1 [Lepisosteus oculatus]